MDILIRSFKIDILKTSSFEISFYSQKGNNIFEIQVFPDYITLSCYGVFFLYSVLLQEFCPTRHIVYTNMIGNYFVDLPVEDDCIFRVVDNGAAPVAPAAPTAAPAPVPKLAAI